MTVELKRKEGVAGPVQLSLTLPPGVQGVTVDPVTVAGEQTTATLTLTAAADATVGKHAFSTIRATVMQQQALSVDAPLTITVPE